MSTRRKQSFKMSTECQQKFQQVDCNAVIFAYIIIISLTSIFIDEDIYFIFSGSIGRQWSPCNSIQYLYLLIYSPGHDQMLWKPSVGKMVKTWLKLLSLYYILLGVTWWPNQIIIIIIKTLRKEMAGYAKNERIMNKRDKHWFIESHIIYCHLSQHNYLLHIIWNTYGSACRIAIR